MRANKRRSVEVLLASDGAKRAYEEELLLGQTKARLDELLEKCGLKRQDLAERLGVSAGRISQILASPNNLTLKTLADMGWAMGYRFDPVPEAISDTPREALE